MKETLEQIRAERDRYKLGLEDQVDFCPYPGGAQHAAHALDLSVPLKRVTPRA